MFVINGEVWRIKMVPSGHRMLRRPDGVMTIGACDDYSKTIYIDKNLRGRRFKEVLCHEITHAAMFSYNVDLAYEQEELIANIIAKYGHEIINVTDRMFKKLKWGY